MKVFTSHFCTSFAIEKKLSQKFSFTPSVLLKPSENLNFKRRIAKINVIPHFNTLFLQNQVNSCVGSKKSVFGFVRQSTYLALFFLFSWSASLPALPVDLSSRGGVERISSFVAITIATSQCCFTASLSTDLSSFTGDRIFSLEFCKQENRTGMLVF